MYTVALIPPNPDCLVQVVIVEGYRKSHVHKFINKYFEIWDIELDANQYKYKKYIHLNSRGRPTKPIVMVKGGCADYNEDEVTILDYDNYEGI